MCDKLIVCVAPAFLYRGRMLHVICAGSVGVFEGEASRLTIKEIAEMAGVSRGTVDRVLNGRGSVSPKTAEKIHKIAAAVNYSPNLPGKILAVKKKQLKFGFILFNPYGNSFFLDVVRGIEDRKTELQEYGVQVEVRYTDMDDTQMQVAQVNELLTSGINGLAITPINHPDVIEKLRDLAQKNIPVVTVNSDIPDCRRIAYVGSEYFKSGETAAGLMNMVCHGNVQVGIVLGSPRLLCHSERVAGFTKRIQEAYPHIDIVEAVVNHDDDVESYMVTTEMLRAHPEINAIFLASAGVSGACRAVIDSGRQRHIKIISYDTTASTCRLIKSGVIAATIAQQPFVQGAKPLDILLDYLGMGILPNREFYYTKIEVKIRENLDDDLDKDI